MTTLEWYERKLDAYDELVKKTGVVLLNIAAVAEEYGAQDLDPLMKDALSRLRKLGETMIESSHRGWRSEIKRGGDAT